MEEQEPKQETGRSWSVGKLFGMGWSRERSNRMYYGNPPKGTYPTDRSIEHIHDLLVTPEQKGRLFSTGISKQVVETRSCVDSKKGLIDELVNETSMTRKEAEALVNKWMTQNGLIEVNDPVLGKYITRR